ncbi:PREDICTED: RNA-directed DNA polymerase from mobile element jockey-like [Dinoponera quadriceps]|uniref:RNA-directed DNA polymerase from mobile element jockey-like n=1 Tax=Dinoponera quadriceps TaxID=609295 RepID=A0A6P3Y1P3_DINQU|nr:PREDICTED: RNA-directed DNA polymerase from mobile element jockey-like [Dinoponera quadriceps]
MAGSIRIVTWNANGLSKHKSELEIFLDDQKIDICLISETHFTKESNFRIIGYETYHTIHPSNKARGGTAIIIRENIKHHEEPKLATESIQAATVSVQCKRYKFTISAVYSLPRHNIQQNEYIEFLQTLENSFIVGGDFNAKHTYWCSRYSSSKGKALFQAGKMLKCDFLSSGSSSYWPADTNKFPDVIDFFVTKGLSTNYINVVTCLDLSSDHTPVILILYDTIVCKENPSLVTKKVDWSNYSAYLEKNIKLNTLLKTSDQVENETKLFTEQLQHASKINSKVFVKTKYIASYSIEIKLQHSWKKYIEMKVDYVEK